MRLLRDDGVAKIRQGLTTVEEVSRVTVRAAT
jgi:type II secretory ATPase GspE/PulE/Tfp pilus assembly ATPase PilB-like protein